MANRTMGAAASAICSADCAARLDQAKRLKVSGRRSGFVAVLTLGVAEGQTGQLQTALTLPFDMTYFLQSRVAASIRPRGRPNPPASRQGGE
ncbi:hypothetical protein [Bradyrhizobium liaoningense]|uniref:hypothetical protein n=1 Tax=Bradyrhizobium liaoningense TaxID=43992 RepID=UPI0020130FB3|nr:hypothetical protein [Bradyrhizobium liaoningense]